MSRTLYAILIAVNFIPHLVVFFADYTQKIKVIDWVKRSDGSRSDPRNLLPLEFIYAGFIGICYGIVTLSFVFAFAGISTVRNAALTSMSMHGLLLIHLLLHSGMWKKTFHPDGLLSYNRFVAIQCVAIALAVPLLLHR
jgi:preprotein translocase subunit SecY